MLVDIILAQMYIGYTDLDMAFSDLEISLNGRSSSVHLTIMVLPELWPCGFNREKLSAISSQENDLISALKSLANKHNIYIAVSVPKKISSNNKLFNSLMFLSPEGVILSEYHKMHLFPLTGEAKIFQAGTSPTILKIKGTKIGFATCYDLRFPEHFCYYAERGVELVLLSACFPDPRKMDWSILLQARAIENQYFMAAVNAVGSEDIEGQNLNYFGHSTVVNPRGEQLLQMERGPGTASLSINTQDVHGYRDEINFLKDRYVY